VIFLQLHAENSLFDAGLRRLPDHTSRPRYTNKILCCLFLSAELNLLVLFIVLPNTHHYWA